MSVLVSMQPSEAEALIHFLADRAELWKQSAKDFGIKEPLRVVLAISEAHHEAVRVDLRRTSKEPYDVPNAAKLTK